MVSALIVDDDVDNLLDLASLFREQGYSAETAGSIADAREALLRRMPDVALVSESVENQDALELLESLDLAPVMEIYLMSDSRTLRNATRAMRIGLADYFSKPVDKQRLASNLEQLSEELSGETATAENSSKGLLLGASAPMERLYRLIKKCAPSEASILVTGESGSGKELVAQSIHQLSRRSGGEFVALNCSALSHELMESELFGHKKGSFTGATRNHRGFFERASGGTLFLDEITEMDVAAQAKLLRVLETNRVVPVGAEKEVTIDVRIVAATNRDPQEAIESGQLREDLYYRIAQFPMRLPPLRERGDDVLLLAEHFLAQQNAVTKLGKAYSAEVLEAFKMHDWPGNVRELRNAVMHGYLLSADLIRPEDLPDGIPATLPPTGQFVRMSIGTSLEEVSRRHILSTLAHFDGDKKRTAETLGISLKTLYNRLKKYGV